MSRLSLALVVLVVLSTLGSAPVKSQAALDADVPLDGLILRVVGDDSWAEGYDANGMPLTLEMFQIQAGVPQVEISPNTAAQYEQFKVQDVYISRNMFYNAYYEQVATTVEMRIITFLDEASASAYLSVAYDSQVEAAAQAQRNLQLAAIDPLPSFNTPTIGWTQVVDYVSDSTEEFSGLTSSVRYLSQVGRVIISAQVTSPFVDFNFDMAHGLIGIQSECLIQEAMCSSISFQEVNGAWQMLDDGILYFTSGASDLTPARWIWPVQEPARAPEVSVSITAAVSAPPTSETTGTILVSVMPVRADPSLEGEIVTNAGHGDIVTITGEPVEGDGAMWLPVIAPDGTPGWLPAEAIEISE